MVYLEAVQDALLAVSPGMVGKLWDRTSGNAFDLASGDEASWILQVPDLWEQFPRDDCTVGTGPGVAVLLKKIRDNISRAERLVDITGFGVPSIIGSPAGPYPDGPFLKAMVDGLKKAVESRTKDDPLLTVRFLTGLLGGIGVITPSDFRQEVIGMLGESAALIDVWVASMRTRGVTSYNHTKFVIVDGQSVIHGGINWMTNYYIEDGPMFSRGYGASAPVTDLDIALRGPAAASSGRFVDLLWEWVRVNRSTGTLLSAVNFAAQVAVSKAVSSAKDWSLYKGLDEEEAGDLDVISVGSLGYGMTPVRDEASKFKLKPLFVLDEKSGLLNRETNTDRDFMTVNPDAEALRALVASATTSIVMSQQDINGFTGSPLGHALYDVRFLDTLAERMIAGVKVRIVISNPGPPDYSNITSLDVAYKSLYDRVRRGLDYDARAHQILRRQLQLAPFRSQQNAEWPSGYKYRLHTKLVCVDDTAFYIGSRNVYPDTTQDHGFIIENRKAAAQLYEAFLKPQWEFSKRGAICDYDW